MTSAPPVKTKFPRAAALAVARDLQQWLSPFCERLIFAGSLRRRKASVGDVELLYIPLFGTVRDGLFDTKQVSAVDVRLEALLAEGFLDKRLNVDGHTTWGEKNKLAVHAFSNIPVDLFAATPANWFNYLVCRTGSAENNTRIAAAAQNKGWKWNPYGMGFTDAHQRIIPVTCERDVFELAGLPYLEPWER
jgi:DNA polymerase (family 10)